MARPEVGEIFAGYRIEDVAGRGGMGIVYRATDLALERTVALKMITPTLADDDDFRRRFIAESKIAASLDHANVIPIYHAGEHDGVLFLVMRYVDGRDLRSLLAETGALSPDRSAAIVAQLGSALDAAHGAGLVHRDVKPANVLITSSDQVFLTDFGLTKRSVPDDDVTQSGTVVGTLNYLAPEQIRGVGIGPATDVYALGCVLFQLLTGRVPFPIETDEGKLWAHLSEAPPAPSSCAEVPQAFDAVVARAMSKSPEDRFPSAGELGVATEAALAPPAPAPARDRPPLRPALLNPFSVVLLMALVAVGVAIGRPVTVVPIALLAYAFSVVVDWRDMGPVEEPSSDVSPIAEIVDEVLEVEAELRERIDEAEVPLDDITSELDRFERVVQRAATRAELLHQELDDGLADTVPARARMESQMRKFYAQMQQMLAELDGIRKQLAPGLPADGPALAAEMRDMRRGISDIGDGLAAARVERSGYPWVDE
jgi:serine/threonine protein kinase